MPIWALRRGLVASIGCKGNSLFYLQKIYVVSDNFEAFFIQLASEHMKNKLKIIR